MSKDSSLSCEHMTIDQILSFLVKLKRLTGKQITRKDYERLALLWPMHAEYFTQLASSYDEGQQK